MSQTPFARGRFPSKSLDPIAEECESPPVSPTTMETICYLDNVSLSQEAFLDETHCYRPCVKIIQKTIRDIDNQLEELAQKRSGLVRSLKQARLAGIHYVTEALKYLQMLESHTTLSINTERNRNESTEMYNTRMIHLAHKYKLLSILKKLENPKIKYERIEDLETEKSKLFIGVKEGNEMYISSNILRPSSCLLNTKNRRNRGLAGVMEVIDSKYIIKIPTK